MSLRRSLAFVSPLLLVVACVSQDAQNSAEQPAAASELQSFLDGAVADGIPGISAAIATRDGVIWTGVAGSSELQANVPVRPDNLFGIGSITKSFVAVVVLQLAEEGKLDLQTTAASVLGAVVDDIPNADGATIAQLLNHTSGVPSWEDDPTWIRDGRGVELEVTRIWDKAAPLQYIKGHPPLAKPGERHSYANTNYTLLGMIIEKVTGEEVVDEIHRRILMPTGITNIYLGGSSPCQKAGWHTATTGRPQIFAKQRV